MADLNDMTLEQFKLWSINSLKVYLSQRKKSVNGSDEELAARAFCAWEEKLPVDEKGEQLELRLLEEYKGKLRVEGDIIPDPFSITKGWHNEQSGRIKWPAVYVSDISEYLNGKSPKDVVRRLLNEYKEGKGFRYFQCEWVKEVVYHDIRDNCNMCILKARVTPSMSVKKWYDAWVVVRKDSEAGPGGQILSGYCSCTAGMLGTCNHIAGLLFRVEHAVKTGITKQSSTSRLCEWNVPKSKTEVKPVMVCEVPWTKGHYAKQTNKEKEKENLRLKNAFTPLSKRQLEEVKNEESIRRQLHGLLQDDIPNSCFALTFGKRRILPKKVIIPPSLPTEAKKLANKCEDPKKFLTETRLSKDQCRTVNDATVDQSQSQDWFDQRKGRITASKFQRVVSRVKTLKVNENASPAALVNEIMGRRTVHQTLAMKHGISMEPVAKRAYMKDMSKKHSKFKACDSGLTIYLEKQYIAASADLKVTCSCCGEGLCEIKCPEKIKDSVPSENNLSYVEKEQDALQLSKTHPYFFQIQGQMGVLGRKYTDLFVYTHHGHLRIRVKFDQQFWEEMVNSLSWFWERHVFPELIKPEPIPETSTKSPTSTKEKENMPPTTEKSPAKTTKLNVRRALQPVSLINKNNAPKQILLSRPSKARKTARKQPVYLCGYCGEVCSEEPESDSEQSVSCDICGVWIHFKCAKVDDSVNDQKEWVCSKCL